MKALKLLPIVLLLVAMIIVAAPAAAGGTNCTVSPATGPVGTTFGISCWGFDPNTITNVYAVEPDGRASGINLYGFFPTSVKTNSSGYASFSFVTEIPAFASIPPGNYIFVVQELAPGGKVAVQENAYVTVGAADRPVSGATLSVTPSIGQVFAFTGTGFAPFEAVNTWVTQPPGTESSGLGIDQLTLQTLATDDSSTWSGPGTVKADGGGNIAFTVSFNSWASRGTYTVTARALGSGRGAEASFVVTGNAVTPTAGASLSVSPNPVLALNSRHTVSGTGFPAFTTVNCWYTRPDGRVLSFISFNANTDGGGSFSAGSHLDDFPPFTSTEPGMWAVTCATVDRSVLAVANFMVVGLTSDP